MRRNLFSMKDDQRRAMFANMRGGSRFADAPDIPKVTVSYGDTTISGGEADIPVDEPKIEEQKIDESKIESTADATYDGIPSSVAPAFEMFDQVESAGFGGVSEDQGTGTLEDINKNLQDINKRISYKYGEDINSNPTPPETIFEEQSVPESISYKSGGKGLEYLPSGGNVVMSETLLDTSPYGNVTDISYDQSLGTGKQQDKFEVVYPEQKDIEVKSTAGIRVVGNDVYYNNEYLGKVGDEKTKKSLQEIEGRDIEVTSRSRLERYQDTLNKIEGFMGKIEDDIQAIDPATNDPAEQERLKLFISNLSNQRHQYESIKKMIDKEKYPETFQGQFKKGWDVGLQQAGRDVAGAIIKSPVAAVRTVGGAVSGAGRLAEREFNLGVAVGGGALARGAEAFGTTAGVGVTEAIRGVGDIIEGPQQEFHIPPGYQKIWDGSKYVVRPQPQYPMEPWAVSKSFGVGMPPGVEPRVQGQSAVPVRDVSRIWGPAAVVAQERGYGGVDYLWGVKDIEQQGFKPMFDVPKMPTPDYMRVGREKQHMWVIPPAEVLYGVQAQPQPKSPYRGTVQRTSYVSSSGVPSMMQRTQGAIVPSNEMLTDGKIRTATLNKIPLLPRFPSDKAKIVPIKMPKTVSRVISDSERLNEISNISGVGSPEYVKQEAKVQSGLDYATRHNLPGSQGRTALEGYGLISPSGV